MWTIDAAALEQRVLAYIRQHELCSPGTRMLLAVSGGADSMALAHMMQTLAPVLGLSLEAIHVDHGLRGEASRQDALFVQAACQSWGMPLHCYDARAQGVEYPANPSEDWARNLRYGVFDRLLEECGKNGPVYVATAHTLSDQAETLLFRLARGTGVHGAGGIRPRRGPYVRPFLCVTREEVEAYCATQGIAYVTDETNLSDAYARNRLRHHALPVLRDTVPGAERSLGRFCEQMQRLDGYFEAKADTLLKEAQRPGGWELQMLRAADWPVRETLLLRLVRTVCDPDEKRMELLSRVVEKGSGAVQLTAQKGLRARRGLLEWFSTEPAPEQKALPQPLQEGIFCFPGGYTLRVQVVKYEKFINFAAISKKDLNSCADYARIQDNVVLRTQQPGDTYRPRARGLTKPLRKMYWEMGVPPAQRPLLPLAARDGQVLWLWGQGFADGLAPGPDTQDVLMITPQGEQEEIR